VTKGRSVGLAFIVLGSSACGDCGSSQPPSPGRTDTEGGTASPRAELDAAVPCSGTAIDLAAVIGDPTCTITSAIAKSTRATFEADADAGRHSLRQEATRLADGRVELRLVNRGQSPVSLPLSWHPKIPAFIVLADSVKEKAIYELEAPTLGVDLDGGPVTARFARVTIAPGGYAFARIAIDPKIVRRAGKTAGDAGAVPSSLHEGKWTLHVGQLVSDVDTGEPAMLGWLIEATD
jgi:hypothetical protein